MLGIGASWVLGSEKSLHVEAAVASVDLPLGYVTLEAAMLVSSSSTGGKGWGLTGW